MNTAVQVNLQLNCPYTSELIRTVLERDDTSFVINASVNSKCKKILHWLEYEDLDFERLYRLSKTNESETTILANAYCIRKGLLRKANFASFVQKYLAKVMIYTDQLF
jgi:tubulin---tyrosine ligase